MPIEKIAYHVKLCDLSLIVGFLVDKSLFLVSVIFLLLYLLPSIALPSMEWPPVCLLMEKEDEETQKGTKWGYRLWCRENR